MFDQIREKAARFDEIEKLIQDPEVASQHARYAALMKERGRLIKLVQPYKELEKVRDDKSQAEELLSDPQMKEVAQEEIAELSKRETVLVTKLEELILTSDPDSGRSVIIEIRPGVGGEEAALFARELFEMYSRYSQKKGWKTQILESMSTDLGGLKFGTMSIEGDEVYRFLKFETGAHRVQRVPKTEASGRVHTSIATVAVMPQAEEIELEIKPADVKIDTFSAGGPGGQHVNKTQSAVRLTHQPTGIVVQCQDQRSQIRNRELAWRWLRAKLYEHEAAQKAKERRDLRRSQVGTGNRNEKIRTYNFHDNRITDNRIKFSMHNLELFLQQGEIDEMIDKLLEEERAKKLKSMGKK